MNVDDDTENNISPYMMISVLLIISFGSQCIKCLINSCEKNKNQQLLNNELKEKINSDSSKECSICLNSMNNYNDLVILKCKHYYHKDCLNTWLNKNNSCPICRISL